MIATITLNPSIDQHLVVQKLVKDDANRARSVASYPGGKGVNVSKVVRELGGPTRAYALAGGFTGDIWRELVAKLDISFSAVPLKDDTRINTIITDVKDRTQTRISAPGPEISPEQLDVFLKKLLSARPKPFLWALGGSLSAGMSPDTYRKLILALQQNGVPCVLDADDEPLRFGIKARPFMIKPNEHEMQRLMNRPLKTMNEYLRAGRLLVRKGIKIVVVSLGKKGALFITEKEAFHVPAPRVWVKSKVGAGDSLIGGFALGLYKKMTLKEAARLGVAASTSAVMREAPRLCLKKDIPGLLPRIAIRSL